MARFPRLSREDELALCQDVQRWLRLEKLREDLSHEEAFAEDGVDDTKVGLETWAEAAGMSVTVSPKRYCRHRKCPLLFSQHGCQGRWILSSSFTTRVSESRESWLLAGWWSARISTAVAVEGFPTPMITFIRLFLLAISERVRHASCSTS